MIAALTPVLTEQPVWMEERASSATVQPVSRQKVAQFLYEEFADVKSDYTHVHQFEILAFKAAEIYSAYQNKGNPFSKAL